MAVINSAQELPDSSHKDTDSGEEDTLENTLRGRRRWCCSLGRTAAWAAIKLHCNLYTVQLPSEMNSSCVMHIIITVAISADVARIIVTEVLFYILMMIPWPHVDSNNNDLKAGVSQNSSSVLFSPSTAP